MARDLFATLDLNLLKTLLVLSQEQNMRKASERLHVTQPAVSQALKKLRHHFGDELFIKIPTGLRATSYTENLVTRISPLIDELSARLNDQQTFDPEDIEGMLRITLSPHIASYLSGRLYSSVREAAPLVSLHLSTWNDKSLENLAKGELHLGVSLEIEQTPNDIMLRKLADDRFTGYVREGHPLLGDRETLTLKDLDGWELATLIIPDWNLQVSHVERLMKAHGYRAMVRFRSDLPAAITDVVRTTDLIYPASSYIEKSDLEGLRALEVKLNNRYLNYPLMAYYHQKDRRNPLTKWLGNLIRDLLLQRK